jgi:DNA-directed RNA polymerase subunit RPC12/RpoP
MILLYQTLPKLYKYCRLVSGAVFFCYNLTMEQNKKLIKCSRCSVKLKFMGTKKFHEGTRWGVAGDLGELFVNKEKYDVYHCPKCGVVEMFVDGVGEDLRPS